MRDNVLYHSLIQLVICDRLGAHAQFTFLPGRSRFNVYNVGDDHYALFDSIAAEMYQVARPSHPAR